MAMSVSFLALLCAAGVMFVSSASTAEMTKNGWSGVRIKKDKALMSLGKKEEIQIFRTGDGELLFNAKKVKIAGKLEVESFDGSGSTKAMIDAAVAKATADLRAQIKQLQQKIGTGGGGGSGNANTNKCKPGFTLDSTKKCVAAYFYLQDKKSGRCVHPSGGTAQDNNVALVFHNGCSGAQLQFQLLPADKAGYVYLRSRDHNRCIHPNGGSAKADNTALVFHEGCAESRLQFKIIPAGEGAYYLQSRDHGRCVHPMNGNANKDNVGLVFHTGCTGDNIKFNFKYAAHVALVCKPGYKLDSKKKCVPAFFFIQDKTSGRCIHPSGGSAKSNNVALVFHSGCTGVRLQFKAVPGDKAGYVYLQSREHNKQCVHASGGAAKADNTALVFHEGCAGSRLQFKIIPAYGGGYYLQSRDHGRCVHPMNGKADKDNVALVFHTGCKGDNIQA